MRDAGRAPRGPARRVSFSEMKSTVTSRIPSLRRSLRWRLVASYVALSLVAVGVAGLIAQSLVGRVVERQQALDMEANARTVALRAESLVSPALRRDALQDLARTTAFVTDARVRVLDAERSATLADSGERGFGEVVVFAAGAVGEPGVPLLPQALAEAPGAQGEGLEDRLAGPMVLAFSAAEGEQAIEEILAREWPEGSHATILRRFAGPFGQRLRIDERSLTGGDVTVEIRHETFIGALPGLRADLLRESGATTETLTFHEGGDIWFADPEEEGADAPRGPDVGPASVAGPGAASSGGGSGPSVAIRALALPAASAAAVSVPVGDPDAPEAWVWMGGWPDLAAAARATTRRAFAYAAVVASLLAVLLGLVVSRGMAAPLADLTEVAGRMTDGDLSARAELGRQDEIGRLAAEFNAMAGRLEDSFRALGEERDALRDFIADASHELRTPITALRAFNELLVEHAAEDPALRAEFLAESRGQLDRLEWITAQLLDLSRLDAGLVEIEREPQEASELWEAAAAPLRPRAAEAGQRIELRAPEEVWVAGDRERLVLALGNLLDNALKLSPSGATIRLGATPDAARAEAGLWIDDEGPGVPVSEQERIFERFYRGEEAQARAPGTGLGLAIVRGVARAHGGRVTLDAIEGGGSRFTLFLPLQER